MAVVSTEKGKVFIRKKKNKKERSMVTMLPEEVIIEHILPRLPIDQLLRSRVVCKNWKQLIRTDDPVFMSRHFHHNPSTSAGCFSHFYRLNRLGPDLRGERIISTLNIGMGHERDHDAFSVGLTNGFYYGFNRDYSYIFISNLFTKRPAILIPNPNNAALAIALANTPHHHHHLNSNSNYNYNFSPGGFLIVAMVLTCDVRNTFQFQLYSSQTAQWRMSKVADFRPPHWLKAIGGVYDGSCRKVFWSLDTHIVWYDVHADDAGIFQTPVWADPCLLFNYYGGPLYSAIAFCNQNQNQTNGAAELSYTRFQDGCLGIWLLRMTNGSNSDDDVDFKWVKIHSLSLIECDDVMSRFGDTRDTWIYAKVLAQMGSVIHPLSHLGGDLLWVWTRTTNNAIRLFSINLKTPHLKLAYYNDHIPVAMMPFMPRFIPRPF
ncbi:hypothetical protein Sjap_015813 [Stephania japonica]|uniref:F-box domain-containing protein n=1 Tax=Stephania japonica TaxID=461633 RepID=A0AAP0ILF9_9MAGN